MKPTPSEQHQIEVKLENAIRNGQVETVKTILAMLPDQLNVERLVIKLLKLIHKEVVLSFDFLMSFKLLFFTVGKKSIRLTKIDDEIISLIEIANMVIPHFFADSIQAGLLLHDLNIKNVLFYRLVDAHFQNDTTHINLTDSLGYTALHHAVLKEDIRLITILLKSGINTDINNHDGKTAADLAKSSSQIKDLLCEYELIFRPGKALLMAIAKRDIEAVSNLLSKPDSFIEYAGASPDPSLAKGNVTPIELAYLLDERGIGTLLVDRIINSAHFHSLIKRINDMKTHSLDNETLNVIRLWWLKLIIFKDNHHGCKQLRHVDLMPNILDAFSAINQTTVIIDLLNAIDVNGDHYLHIIIKMNDINRLRHLLQFNPSLQIKNNKNQSPMDLLINTKSSEMINHLTSYAHHYFATQLMSAIKDDNDSLISSLLDHAANLQSNLVYTAILSLDDSKPSNKILLLLKALLFIKNKRRNVEINADVFNQLTRLNQPEFVTTLIHATKTNSKKSLLSETLGQKDYKLAFSMIQFDTTAKLEATTPKVILIEKLINTLTHPELKPLSQSMGGLNVFIVEFLNKMADESTLTAILANSKLLKQIKSINPGAEFTQRIDKVKNQLTEASELAKEQQKQQKQQAEKMNQPVASSTTRVQQISKLAHKPARTATPIPPPKSKIKLRVNFAPYHQLLFKQPHASPTNPSPAVLLSDIILTRLNQHQPTTDFTHNQIQYDVKSLLVDVIQYIDQSLKHTPEPSLQRLQATLQSLNDLFKSNEQSTITPPDIKPHQQAIWCCTVLQTLTDSLEKLKVVHIDSPRALKNN